jgi:DNA-binding NtrC family response regulator
LLTVRAALADALRIRGWNVVEAGSEAQLQEALAAQPFDVVVIDPSVLGMEPRAVPPRIAQWRPGAEVVLMTHCSDGAASAMMGGAAEFVQRPFRVEELELRLLRLRRDREHRSELERVRAILYEGGRLRGFSGDSPSTRSVCERVRLFADQTAPALVTGERGTGKKLVAAAIHELGGRRSGPFVIVRAGESPANLPARILEAADHARGGTLLIHGVDGCDRALQERLLDLLTDGRFPGSTQAEPSLAAVRILATAEADLADAVHDGRFSGKLWELIGRLQIHLPALRQRGDDIVDLAQQFLRSLADRRGEPPKVLAPEAAFALRCHTWPGNVTELHHSLAAAAAAAGTDDIGLAELPASITDGKAVKPPFTLHLEALPPLTLPALLDRLERELVEWALDRAGGDHDRAAEMLGVPAELIGRWR